LWKNDATDTQIVEPAPLQLFVVLLTVAIAASARAQQPSQEELSNKINGLQSQIDELKEQLKQAQAERAAEVAATTQAVMRDAESRSHPLSLDGVTATYTDGKFTLRTADGNFVLRPWLQFQLRNTTTYRQDVKQGGTGDDVQNGFEIRRLKLGLEGNVFSPDLSYNFIWAANRKDGVQNSKRPTQSIISRRRRTLSGSDSSRTRWTTSSWGARSTPLRWTGR
jgi:hypothetical protein